MDYDHPDLRGLPCTIPEFARMSGMSDQRIRQLMRDGLPVFKQGDRGKQHVLSSADCIDWLIDRAKKAKSVGRPKLNGEDNNNNDPRSQINALRMRKMEMEIAERRGDLVHAEDWSLAVEECMIALRTTGGEMPNDFRNEFSDQPQITRMSRWLNNWVTNWLNTFARNLHRVPEESQSDR